MASDRFVRPFDFSEATALVVGGASGLGRAMAEGLAQHGARVCVSARTDDKARRAADEIAQATGARCVTCAADVASEASVERLGQFVDAEFGGRLNIAVNSSGINIRNPIDKVSLA